MNRVLKKSQIAAAFLTAGAVATAIGFDLRSEEIANQNISTVSTDVMDRFRQCQDENQTCNTPHDILNACIEKKADSMNSQIAEIRKKRTEEQWLLRSTMGSGIGYIALLCFLWRRQQKTTQNNPSAPKPD